MKNSGNEKIFFNETSETFLLRLAFAKLTILTEREMQIIL